MFYFAAILLLVPLAGFFLSRKFSSTREGGWRTASRVLALFAVGLAAASPFLTSRGVGTGEAYNYSLALADAVTQMRAGEIPPLVGQTEYAFNGRVHPLRNAPYLFYLAGALDALTFRQLSFWELQNLSLALSFVFTVFACYVGLRWGTECNRGIALGLAAAYGLCPAVLVNGTVNLFMTVHVAVFAPLAIGACLRQCRHPSAGADIALATALAAAWLAHPPVALWLTAVVGLVRLLILWRNPTWQAGAGLLGATLLGLALAGFVFASVATLSIDLGYFPGGEDVHLKYVGAMMENIHAAFPGSLEPVGARASLLADIQFGYVAWLLLGVTGALSLRRARANDPATDTARIAGLGLTAVAGLFLVMLLPVPHVTRWLWTQVPIAAQALTTVWPMQRLYLVATVCTIFATALELPHWLPLFRRYRSLSLTVLVLCAAWTLHEAAAFVAGGLALRWPEDSTRRSHQTSNLDLTIISYAFLSVPPTFVNGVMDPLFEFQLLKSGRQEVDSPLKAALATAPVIARGDIFQRPNQPMATAEVTAQKLILEPGRRYLLTFNFLTPPIKGVVDVIGPTLLRHYGLPAAGAAEGFGMGEGHQHSVSIWTSLPVPETVDVRLAVTEWPSGGVAANSKVAEFTLQAVDLGRLPVRLETLLPLRCTVESPEPGCFLSTPRRYVAGYVGKVNGGSVRPIRSPDGNVMLPVPQGHSVVELDYSGGPLVRGAFWVTALAWLGLLVWAGGRIVGFEWEILARGVAQWAAPAAIRVKPYGLPISGVTIVIMATTAFLVQRTFYRSAVGPIRISFLLPFKQTGRQQPILVTGRPGAGTNVFIGYLDDAHIRIGADIWGALYQTGPVPVDYFLVQDLVVNSSALYPLDHPRVRALPSPTRERLRNDFRVELNGHNVLSVQRSAYESTVDAVTVGETRIGGSLTQPKFVGEILGVARLPIPTTLVVAHDQDVRLHLRFPVGREGVTEALLSLGTSGRDGVCCVSYLAADRLRFSYCLADGSIIDSASLSYDARQPHDLRFKFGRAKGQPDGIGLEFDGAHVLGPKELEPQATPLPVCAGFSGNEVEGMEVRFTGPELQGTVVSKNPGAARETSGPLRLIVTLPRDKPGRPEPLVTTGRAGAGDFAYVTYVDAHHVRFGLDHWGVGGATSEPIELDYNAPHEIEIRLGSLYPEENTTTASPPDSALRLHKSNMEIRLDGRTVLHAPLPAHPSTADEIVVGANRIGGSNCDTAFTGEIHVAERLGSTP